ncbi:MAG: 2TM domain-containing protein [Polyangiaceae bacterium]
MASPKGRSYDEAEVRAILDRALRGPDGQPSGGDLSHEQLLELGAEVGVSRQSMERAALEVTRSKSVAALEQRIVSRRRHWFGHHLSLFLSVNGTLFLINALTTPGQWWFLFPFVLMLLPLGVHARFGLSRYVSERALRGEAKRAAAQLPAASSSSDLRQRIAGGDADEMSAAENEEAAAQGERAKQ